MRFPGLRILFAALVLVMLAPAAPSFADGRPMVLPTDPAPLTIGSGKGGRSFSIEIADDPEEEERGLMFRRTMGDWHGMLFVLDQIEVAAFWMKNTPMPLDLVFIGADGKVRAIRQGKPYSTDIISPDVAVRFVLELKAGMAAKAGIGVGTRLHHPAIDRIAGAG